MTITEFNNLSISKKEDVIFQQSEFLYVHTVGNEKHGLYSNNFFFIEIICDSETLATKEINSFNSGKLLDKYSSYLAFKTNQ
ncbi:hypothetical protein ULVI_09420 [Cochleicola gelatinilyticus]|uniref:Uncharacterized protein n=2 Tax=Cochleicola gelatinilyticus TaxID=1763537 RepID=A0A167HN74_9FLAO|nr:hypothetical protein ULVI_09420 [Cochleicola gelatinilyticus]